MIHVLILFLAALERFAEYGLAVIAPSLETTLIVTYFGSEKSQLFEHMIEY